MIGNFECTVDQWLVVDHATGLDATGPGEDDLGLRVVDARCELLYTRARVVGVSRKRRKWATKMRE